MFIVNTRIKSNVIHPYLGHTELHEVVEHGLHCEVLNEPHKPDECYLSKYPITDEQKKYITQIMNIKVLKPLELQSALAAYNPDWGLMTTEQVHILKCIIATLHIFTSTTHTHIHTHTHTHTHTTTAQYFTVQSTNTSLQK